MKTKSTIVVTMVLLGLCFVRGYCSDKTFVPPNARYELMEADFGNKSRKDLRILRIDRFTGFVSIFRDKNKNNLPGAVNVFSFINRDRPSDDISKQGRVNYQLFSSGRGVDHVFLINVNTGAVWRLRIRGGGYYFVHLGKKPDEIKKKK